MKKSLLLLTPVLFAISYLLTLYEKNITLVSLKNLVDPIIVTIPIVLFTTLVNYKILKSLFKSIILTSLIIILFFVYGDLWQTFNWFYFHFWSKYWGINAILFPMFTLIVLFSFFTIRKLKISLNKFVNFVIFISLFVIILPTFKIVTYEINQRQNYQVKSELVIPQRIGNLAKENLPDIYLIMPEDYSSPEILKQYFNYDSSQFIKDLKDRDFYVATQSSSNYPKTFLSLASAFNMEYLNYLEGNLNSGDQSLTNTLIANNNVLKFLKAAGYKYFQMGSWWVGTENNIFADDNISIENDSGLIINGFNYLILKYSALNTLLEKISNTQVLTESDRDKWRRTEYQFSTLPLLTQLASPKMIFTHILSPHEPYVYGKTCQFQTLAENGSLPEIQNYRRQVNCINQKIITTIDQIKSRSKQPPIILIVSDEGAPFLANEVNPSDSWEKADAELLQKKFPILTALYLPNYPYEGLYPQITPVNIFRLIFNYYFKTNLPLLPDKNYIFPNLNNLYEFRDVTSIVQEQYAH